MNLRVGDWVWFSDYSTALGDYSPEQYDIFMSKILEIERITENYIKFFQIDMEVRLYSSWGSCPFEKDIHYTRKMKITKLLKNESI